MVDELDELTEVDELDELIDVAELDELDDMVELEVLDDMVGLEVPGNGGTVFAPVISVRFFVFPAAFPAVNMFCASHTALWSGGMVRPISSSGASMMVATRPIATCHSMWQWKSWMPGLSATNRITAELLALTVTTSRLMGTSGKLRPWPV